MITDPTIIERPEQPYAGIKLTVPMRSLGKQATAALPEVFGWLAQHGIEPAGAPFFKFNVINMERDMEIEVGIPVSEPVQGEGRVHGGVLPGGRFATLSHFGSYQGKGIFKATVALLEWGGANDVKWDRHDVEAGDAWACRLEIYETDPEQEPDKSKWRTDLVFKLAG